MSRFWLTVGALLLVVSQTHADEITTIESELTIDAMGPAINLELATNIWTAHEDTPYALVEPDSLELSIEAVLRALSVAGLEGGLIQSNIAIDDQAGISFSCGNPCAIDFGDVPVGQSSDPVTIGITSVPEPGELGMALVGFLALVGLCVRRCLKIAQ